MPKITGGLADISTEIPTLPEGDYPFRIKDVTLGQSKKSKVPMFTIEFTVFNDDQKIPIWEYITTTTKEGDRNEAGLRRLKRIIEWMLGEEAANDPDFDTDSLIGLGGTAVLTQKEEEDPNTGETVLRNRIKRLIPSL